MRRWLIGGLIAAAGVLAAAPIAAQAAVDPSCDPVLVDSAGGHWNLNPSSGDGTILDGAIDTDVPLDGTTNRSDAYDNYPYFSVAPDDHSWTNYDAGATATCTSNLGGREVVFPPVTVDGLSLGRRVYVPAEGAAFARFLNVLSNPGDAPVSVNVDLGGSSMDFGDLGSDDGTLVFSSSSGDPFVSLADAWATTWDGAVDTAGVPDGDPGIGHLWQSPILGGDRADALNPSAIFDAIFNQVTVQPGQTLIYMQVERLAASPDAAGQAVATLSSEPAELYAGLSDADRAAVQNFCVGDCDRDGRTDGTAGTAVADNCPGVANADQADLDADGIGDACESDTDGDGVTDAAELDKGTDAHRADTDGDGVRDDADACPAVAGRGANGCPRFDDATAPKVTVSALKKTVKRSALRRGVKGRVACDESCSFELRLVGSRKGARIAKAGDLELGSKRLGPGTGARSFTVKVSKSLANATRKGAKLRLVVTATDAGNNRTVVTRSISVK